MQERSAFILAGLDALALTAQTAAWQPAGHPLWHLPNVIITPHVATTPAIHAGALCGRIRDNVSRFCQGQDLDGVVQLDRGY